MKNNRLPQRLAPRHTYTYNIYKPDLVAGGSYIYFIYCRNKSFVSLSNPTGKKEVLMIDMRVKFKQMLIDNKSRVIEYPLVRSNKDVVGDGENLYCDVCKQLLLSAENVQNIISLYCLTSVDVVDSFLRSILDELCGYNIY